MKQLFENIRDFPATHPDLYNRIWMSLAIFSVAFGIFFDIFAKVV